jgi:hypothetical protein
MHQVVYTYMPPLGGDGPSLPFIYKVVATFTTTPTIDHLPKAPKARALCHQRHAITTTTTIIERMSHLRKRPH